MLEENKKSQDNFNSPINKFTNSFARQYLTENKIELFQGEKKILLPINKLYDTSLLRNGFFAGIVFNEEEVKIIPITKMSLLLGMGFGIASEPLRYSGGRQYVSGQHVHYVLYNKRFSRLPQYVTDLNAMPRDHTIEYDTVNKKLRLVGRNSGYMGYGPWVKIDISTSERMKRTKFTTNDFLNRYDDINKAICRNLTNEPEEPVFIRIPELPFMMSESNEIVCIPQGKDEPRIGVFGQTGPITLDTNIFVDNKCVQLKEIIDNFEQYKGRKVISLNQIKNNYIEKDEIVGFVNAGIKKTLKIKTKKGREITCCLDHTFLTHRGNIQARDIKVNDLVPIISTKINKKPRKNKKNPIPDTFESGFFLGMYLSEGNLYKNHITITNGTKECVDFVQANYPFGKPERHKFWKKETNCWALTVYNRKLFEFLLDTCDTGAHKKRVPSFAFTYSDAFKEGIISGYLSGDGCASKNGNSIKVTYCSKSHNLRDGISLLLSNFNIVSNNTDYIKRSGPRKGKKYFWGTICSEDINKLKHINIIHPKKRKIIESEINGRKNFGQMNVFDKIKKSLMNGNKNIEQLITKCNIKRKTLRKYLRKMVKIGIISEKKIVRKFGKRKNLISVISINKKFNGKIKGKIMKQIIGILKKRKMSVSNMLNKINSDWRSIYRAAKKLEKIGAVKVETKKVYRSSKNSLNEVVFSIRLTPRTDNLFWDEITSIEENGRELVYCISTKKNHNFMLYNGLFTHNSGKTYMVHGMCDRVFWKPEWNKKLVIINDTDRQCATWCKPNISSKADIIQLQKLNEIPMPLPCVFLHPHLNDHFDRVHPEEVGFDITLPYTEIIENFRHYFKLGDTAQYFAKYKKELLEEVKCFEDIRPIFSNKGLNPQIITKIEAHLGNMLEEGITDINTNVPSEWRVQTPDHKETYNPITACLVAGVVPILETGTLLNYERFPQYFKYFASDVFEKQVQDREFRRKNRQIWFVADEAHNISSTEQRTVADAIFKRIITEGRQRRIGAIIATQTFSKLDRRVAQNIKYIITFANPSEANKIQTTYNMPKIYANQIKELNKFECIAYTTDEFVIYDVDGNRRTEKGPIKGKSLPPLSLHKEPKKGGKN